MVVQADRDVTSYVWLVNPSVCDVTASRRCNQCGFAMHILQTLCILWPLTQKEAGKLLLKLASVGTRRYGILPARFLWFNCIGSQNLAGRAAWIRRLKTQVALSQHCRPLICALTVHQSVVSCGPSRSSIGGPLHLLWTTGG
jgi:hypothetical protein